MSICRTYYHTKILFTDSFRYDNLVDVPRVRTTKYGKSSFCYEAAGVWNSLPNDLPIRSSGGWSTHGAAHHANVQRAKVTQFYFTCAYASHPSLLFYLLCFAKLLFCLYFQFALLLQLSYLFIFSSI